MAQFPPAVARILRKFWVISPDMSYASRPGIKVGENSHCLTMYANCHWSIHDQDGVLRGSGISQDIIEAFTHMGDWVSNARYAIRDTTNKCLTFP